MWPAKTHKQRKGMGESVEAFHHAEALPQTARQVGPPKGAGAVANAGAVPLSMAAQGQTVQVVRIGGAEDTRRFLQGLGFVEGGTVQVVCHANGDLIVDVKGARVALGSQMARKVMVW